MDDDYQQSVVQEETLARHEYGYLTITIALIILLCTVCAHLIRKYKVTHVPESVAYVVVGFTAAMVSLAVNKDIASYLVFHPSLFYFGLVPPIMMEAGYTLKRKQFFRNFISIVTFAVFGTFVSTLVVGCGVWFGYNQGWFGSSLTSSFNFLEAMMFAALVSAVDPVATLSVLGSKEINADPMLYSLIFGESVLNDAVCIVLYTTLDSFDKRTESFGYVDVFYAIGLFFGISIGSILLGVSVALICSFLFKRYKLEFANEFLVVFVFAYLAYSIAEVCYLSGIMSVFFAGITLAHYNWHNLSREGQMATEHGFASLATAAEIFVFVYLGLVTALSTLKDSSYVWSGTLISWTIFLCILGRGIQIFMFSGLLNLRRKKIITIEMQILMWFAGLRGCIAFALSLTFPGENEICIVPTTLALVMFTTFMLGAGTEKMASLLGLKRGPQDQDASFINGGDGEFNHKTISVVFDANISYRSFALIDTTPAEEYSNFHKAWQRFDRNYMQSIFGGRQVRQNTVLSNDHESCLLGPDNPDMLVPTMSQGRSSFKNPPNMLINGPEASNPPLYSREPSGASFTYEPPQPT
eukprot:g5818.t1